MTPAARRERARRAAHVRWAKCTDRTAATEPARRGFQARFERQVDPDGLLDPQERSKRANHAMRAHLAAARLRNLT